jgi:hypothetical protein
VRPTPLITGRRSTCGTNMVGPFTSCLASSSRTRPDYNQIRDDLKAQIAQILTGLSTDALEDLAPIFFIDPVTEKKITSWRPDPT